jgi:mono/diheme cytochrome c family protein/uncharacterized membrane protein
MMTELMYFLGRFHVLVLHLPIGILMLAVLLEVLVRRPKFQALEPAMPVVWLAGAVSALITVVLGYMLAAEGGFDGPAVNLHRWGGSLLALFAFIVWAWRGEFPASYPKGWPLAVVGTTALLFATGHYGGNLTHGSTYLAEYAPGPLRALAGAPKTVARPAVTNVAAADIYLDVVAPALEKRCAGCHNDDKRRGELSMTTYAKLMKGGETGPSIVPGDPSKSDLYRRVMLASDHVDYMPKDGKPPLTAQEIEAIKWWIAAGAPQSGTLQDLDAPAEVQSTIAGALGLPASAPSS